MQVDTKRGTCQRILSRERPLPSGGAFVETRVIITGLCNQGRGMPREPRRPCRGTGTPIDGRNPVHLRVDRRVGRCGPGGRRRPATDDDGQRHRKAKPPSRNAACRVRRAQQAERYVRLSRCRRVTWQRSSLLAGRFGGVLTCPGSAGTTSRHSGLTVARAPRSAVLSGHGGRISGAVTVVGWPGPRGLGRGPRPPAAGAACFFGSGIAVKFRP